MSRLFNYWFSGWVFDRRVTTIAMGSAFRTLMTLLLLATPALAAPPNIVLILADELGGTIGGQGVPTPNIAAIAAGGTVFTNAYASPKCVASRAKLLTGRYEQAMGIYGNPKTDLAKATFGLPLLERTLADALRDQHYATGIFGKWHLGDLPQFRPLLRGFEEGHYVLHSDAPYLPPNDPLNPVYHDGLVVQEERYLTTAFGAEAAAFVHRNATRPFFLYAPFTATHGPLQATPELMARVPADVPAERRLFAAVLLGLDDAVGAILAAIRAEDLEAQTIVVFMGDNGCAQKSGCSNGGLRGFKGSSYEAWDTGAAGDLLAGLDPEPGVRGTCDVVRSAADVADRRGRADPGRDGRRELAAVPVGRAWPAPPVPGLGCAEQRGDPLRRLEAD